MLRLLLLWLLLGGRNRPQLGRGELLDGGGGLVEEDGCLEAAAAAALLDVVPGVADGDDAGVVVDEPLLLGVGVEVGVVVLAVVADHAAQHVRRGPADGGEDVGEVDVDGQQRGGVGDVDGVRVVALPHDVDGEDVGLRHQVAVGAALERAARLVGAALELLVADGVQQLPERQQRVAAVVAHQRRRVRVEDVARRDARGRGGPAGAAAQLLGEGEAERVVGQVAERLGLLGGLEALGRGAHAVLQAREDGVEGLRGVVEVADLEAAAVLEDEVEGDAEGVGGDGVLLAEGVLGEDDGQRAEHAGVGGRVRVVLVLPAHEAPAEGVQMPQRLDHHVQKAIVGSCIIR